MIIMLIQNPENLMYNLIIVTSKSKSSQCIDEPVHNIYEYSGLVLTLVSVKSNKDEPIQNLILTNIKNKWQSVIIIIALRWKAAFNIWRSPWHWILHLLSLEFLFAQSDYVRVINWMKVSVNILLFPYFTQNSH